MSDFPIPHIEPIRFVKHLISSSEEDALVEVEFDCIPTLGMLIEAAAQSSSGLTNNRLKGKAGFLVSLKNIKLIEKPQNKNYKVQISLDTKFGNLTYVSFKIIDLDVVATGSLVVSI